MPNLITSSSLSLSNSLYNIREVWRGEEKRKAYGVTRRGITLAYVGGEEEARGVIETHIELIRRFISSEERERIEALKGELIDIRGELKEKIEEEILKRYPPGNVLFAHSKFCS